ncbi:MAG: cytochrome c [Gammaproteobacteria bacterium]|nr:cytochrome c [Gammaproteobacteria bacterium]MDH5800840.1 cytochrome c [Gammaproteobacteria bacterium]
MRLLSGKGCLGFVLFSWSLVCVAGDPFIGNQIYNEHCASCHGSSGKANIAGTPDFAGNPMLLAKPDLQLRDTIASGRNLMPAFVGILKEKQMMDVIAYIRTFH